MIAQPEPTFDEQYATVNDLLLQDPPAAVPAAQTLLKWATQQQRADLSGQAQRLLAKVHGQTGDKVQAVALLQAAIRFLKRHKLTQQIMQSYDELANQLYEQLEYYPALDAWLKSLEIATALQDSPACIRAYIGVGKVHFAFGDFRQAMHFHQLAKSLSTPLQDAQLDCKVALNIAADAYRLGEYDEAMAALEQVAEHVRNGLNKPAWEAEMRTYTGLIHLHFERYYQAQELLSQAYQLFRQNRLIAGQGQVMIALARCFTALMQNDLAEECLLEAARLSAEHQQLVLGVESHTLLAQLYLDLGQYQSALQHRKQLHHLLTGQSVAQGFPLQISSQARTRLRKIERELETRKTRQRLLNLIGT